MAYRLGVEVRSFAESTGGTVFATTSRRTGRQAAPALKKGLGHCGYLHEWEPAQSDNPYLAYLALADILIVTGESESMLADAAATGKPVYIYPLPKQEFDRWTRVKEWIVAPPVIFDGCFSQSQHSQNDVFAYTIPLVINKAIRI